MIRIRQPEAVTIILLFVFLLGIASVYNANNSREHSSARHLKQQTAKLLFSDEFNGITLDKSKWVTCYDWATPTPPGCTNFGNDESEWYASQQLSVVNGTLQIQAKRQDTPGSNKLGVAETYRYASGMISSGKGDPTSSAKWVNAYGYYEARMNVPDGKAIWPAFWLVPQGTEWPPEIDIMEIIGDKPNQVLNTYFWKDTQGQQAKDSLAYTAPKNLTNEWHTYGLDWQRHSITWYLDGKQIRSISSLNVPTEKMEMIINLAVGGRLPGYPDGTTPQLSTLKVDYVRVYNIRPQ